MNKLILKSVMCGVSVLSFGLNVVFVGATAYLAVKQAVKPESLETEL